MGGVATVAAEEASSAGGSHRSPELDGRRILVARLDEIGDTVLTTPTLRELRHNAPDAHVTLVVKPGVAGLVATCPYVDEVVTYDWGRRRVPLRPDGLARLGRLWWRRLRRERFDIALVPRWDVDYYNAVLLAFLSGASRRVGYSASVTPRKRVWNLGYDRLLTDALPGSGTRHEVERALDVVRYAGGNVCDDRLELWSSSSDVDAVEAFLLSAGVTSGEELVALGIGAGSPHRCWPVDRYRALVQATLRARPVRFVVVGGPHDRSAVDALAAGMRPGTVICAAGQLSLRQSTELLRRCRLFVGNDAGPMHLAAAAATPVVEISCHPATGNQKHANSPIRFGPWRVSHRVLQPRFPTRPCTDACRQRRPHCLLAIGVDEVAAAVADLLGAAPPRPARSAG